MNLLSVSQWIKINGIKKENFKFMNQNHMLESYGYTPFYEKQITEDEKKAGLIPARVINIQKETYQIVSEHGSKLSKLKSTCFYNNSEFVTYPAVGDFVLVRYNELGDDLIYRVLDRKSSFTRKNPSVLNISNSMEQVVASNFDYILIATSLNQDYNPRRIERYLATAWQTNATPVIVLTKADLMTEDIDLSDLAEVAAGIDLFTVSSVTGEGIDELRAFLKPQKTYAITGSSGIGKSSLLNALSGEELMKVNNIREDDAKGRHTTTYRQLFALSNGALFIDTPGMRELQILDVEDGLKASFQEVVELAQNCRFSDCSHESEPGCAVKKAIEDGELSMERFLSYKKLQKESAHAALKATILQNKVNNYAKKMRKQYQTRVK